MTCDLIVIGAGPGGYDAAVLAAKRGWSVVLIEAEKIGGTCLNWGCIPTKSYCKNASLLEELKEAEAYGVKDLSYSFDFNVARERKNQVVGQLTQGMQFFVDKSKTITYVQGMARFEDTHTVAVNGERYTAERIIIATGSVSAMLPIAGTDLSGVVTSKEILDLDAVPKRLCVIGAGVIGLEFASVFSRFGAQVTVLEYAKEILPNFDSDLAKRLKQSLVKKGIAITNQAMVQGIAQGESGLTVSYQLKEETLTCEADVVLMAVGRKANVGTLNLAEIGIEFSPRGINTDEVLQTNVPGIYAVGDVNGKCMLAHAASFQATKAVNHMQGVDDSIRLDIIPAAVFISPEAAMVGLTEEQCKEAGIGYKAVKSFFRSNGKAVCMGETDGLCKMIIATDGRILGCHLFGPHAADLIHEISSMMNMDVTLTQFRNFVHAHPTLSEVIQECGKEG